MNSAASQFFLMVASVMLTHSQKLIKEQKVKCEGDRMDLDFEFESDFDGFVFVEKYFENSRCRWNGDHSKRLKISIPFSALPGETSCGTFVNQTTGELTVALVVSPLRGILVSGITNVHAQCTYFVNDITVTLPGVHIIPVESQTDLVTGSGIAPMLLMQVLEGHGINGNVLTQASVGQKITLDVVLKETAIYDFYAYSCHAHDGTNSSEASVQIIDANGCGVRLARAIDVPVMNQTKNGEKHIYMHMYGFQFTSSQYVHFECQVRSCVHSCERPQCMEHTQIRKGAGNSQRRRRQQDDRKSTNLRLHTMLHMKPQIPEAAELRASSFAIDCIPLEIAIGVLFAAGITLLLISTLIYSIHIYKRKNEITSASTTSEASSQSSDFSQIANSSHSFIHTLEC